MGPLPIFRGKLAVSFREGSEAAFTFCYIDLRDAIKATRSGDDVSSTPTTATHSIFGSNQFVCLIPHETPKSLSLVDN